MSFIYVYGSKNPRARKVLVSGIEYLCIKDAAIANNIKPGTLRTQFSRFSKTNKWPEGFAYI